ncbi:MAG: hypothetical protein GY938_31025 [Ketobacter sp.]|nr:hypothetical protein [Ketobacter sp.]
MARKTSIRREVLKADPAFTQLSKRPVEYEFSNSRIFRGVTSNRGVYSGRTINFPLGRYTATIHNADISFTRQLNLDLLTYSLTFYDVALEAIEYTMLWDLGTYNLAYNDVTFVLYAAMEWDLGTYNITFNDVTLDYSAGAFGIVLEDGSGDGILLEDGSGVIIQEASP